MTFRARWNPGSGYSCWVIGLDGVELMGGYGSFQTEKEAIDHGRKIYEALLKDNPSVNVSQTTKYVILHYVDMTHWTEFFMSP